MNYTLNKAAKLCGRSKSTLSNAIKNGRLSADKDENGRYSINAAELNRVFPLPAPDQKPEPIQNAEKNIENSVLSAQVEAKDQIIRNLEQTCDDLRKRLDAEAEERRNLTRMLTDQRPQSETPLESAQKPVEGPQYQIGWWDRFLGRKALREA